MGDVRELDIEAVPVTVQAPDGHSILSNVQYLSLEPLCAVPELDGRQAVIRDWRLQRNQRVCFQI